MPSLHIHYESNGDDFVFPIEEIEDVCQIGENDMNNISSLPHAHSNENQNYDRGKNFVEVWWPGVIVCT